MTDDAGPEAVVFGVVAGIDRGLCIRCGLGEVNVDLHASGTDLTRARGPGIAVPLALGSSGRPHVQLPLDLDDPHRREGVQSTIDTTGGES